LLRDPVAFTITGSRGTGDIFRALSTHFWGGVCSLFFGGIRGRPFDVLMHMRYDDDPRKFEVTILDLLRKYAPPIYDRVNVNEFGVTRSEDVLQGAITPTVRKGYSALGNGKFAIALGDIHMLQDPVIAQGANMASRCAWLLGEALLQDSAADEAFCHNTEQRLWDAGRSATEWTNITLQPPPPFVMELFAAAAHNKAVADELVDNFNAPELNRQIFSSPESAGAFLKKHTMRSNARKS